MIRTVASSPSWVVPTRLNPSAKMRLFCFPYAGSGATIYQSWWRSLPPTIEVCPVQLPGRGARLQEQPFTRLEPLVREVADGIAPYLDKPFAFFGHSMGALISFELARRLRRSPSMPQPLHLFVSGSGAPQLGPLGRPLYALPEPELLDELRRLNGTPEQVLAHPELMALMLPIIRVDFEVCQTYSYIDESPLECPITAFGGLADVEVHREHVREWQQQTASDFSMWMLPGDHFFLHTLSSQLFHILSQQIERLVSSID